MRVEKLSISIPVSFTHFIEEYQATHACKSKSEVIQIAINLLRQKELENAYCLANKEIDPEFDNTSADGLDDE